MPSERAYPFGTTKGCLVVLVAYFDESGAKDTPVMTMAGYMADERRWKRFEREWAKGLNEYGAKYLHMREYAQSKGEFNGWPEWKRVALMQKLTWVIRSNVMYMTASAVVCSDYKATVGSIDPSDTRRSPFWLCYLSCISSILLYCQKETITDDVALVFDENSESSKHAIGFFTAFKDYEAIPNRSQLVSLSFADDKKITPLQAADLLAYEFNKYHRGFKRKPLKLLGGVEGGFMVWNREQLNGYMKTLARGV